MSGEATGERHTTSVGATHDDALAEVRFLAITHSGLAHAPTRSPSRLRDPQPLEVIPRVYLVRSEELLEHDRDT